MTVDPRNFLLNTDYEMDKIILFKDGSFTQSTEIAHNLSFIPLTFGVWSTDSDFTSTNTIAGLDSNPVLPYTPLLSVELYASATKLKLESAGNTNNTPIYYRIYGIEPSGSTQTAPATNTSANKFILNTDYNYTKLMATGEFTSAGQEYQHNLGYIPQVLTWVKTSFVGEPVIEYLSSASEYTGIKVTVTENKIICGAMPSVFVDKIYWRIYYDEA